jgi:hypothetical protein
MPSDAGCEFLEHEPVIGGLDDRELGDDKIDATQRGQRQRAFPDDFGRASRAQSLSVDQGVGQGASGRCLGFREF